MRDEVETETARSRDLRNPLRCARSRHDQPVSFVQLLNGVQFGILLFLVAAGLTLVFGIMDFINLAHGVQ